MPALTKDPEAPTADGASSPEPNGQKHVRTIFGFRTRSVKSALVVAAVVISASSVAYHYENRRSLEDQSQNDRPVITILNAGIEAVDLEHLNLTLELKNVAPKTAYSLVISVVGFNPRTERARQLAAIADTTPMRPDTFFTLSAPIKRAEMLPVAVLCLLYADETKRGFKEHLFYDASEKLHIDQRVKLRELSRDERRRVDDSNVCRL